LKNIFEEHRLLGVWIPSRDLAVASGEMSEKEFTAWLRENSKKR